MSSLFAENRPDENFLASHYLRQIFILLLKNKALSLLTHPALIGIKPPSPGIEAMWDKDVRLSCGNAAPNLSFYSFRF